jgi:STE24 endopeptidase
MVRVVCIALVVLIAPLFIFPLFNNFTTLERPRIKDPILSLARANGIPATEY